MKKNILTILLVLFAYINCSSQPYDPPPCDNQNCDYNQLPWVNDECQFNFPTGSQCTIRVIYYKKEGWCNGVWIRELQITEFFITTPRGYDYCGLDDEAIFKTSIERLLFNWTYWCVFWNGLQYDQQYSVKIRIPQCFYKFPGKYLLRLRYCSDECCEQEYTMIYNQQGNFYQIGNVSYTNNNLNCEEILQSCSIKPCQWYLPQFYYPPLPINNPIAEIKNNDNNLNIRINKYNILYNIDFDINHLIIELYSILGERVFSEVILISKGENTYSIQLEKIRTGFYFLRVSNSNNFIKTEKVMIINN